MPCVSDTELAKAVRSGEFSKLYYFYGKDTATLEAYTRKLVSRLIPPDAQMYNLHAFRGSELSLSELEDVCETLPMFSERVCVTINDLNVQQMSASDFKRLSDILNGLADTTSVVIYATGFDPANGKKTMSGNNKKLCDLCAKIGTVCVFDYKTAKELVKPIVASVNKKGSTISPFAAEYLAGQCLCSMMQINNEIDKLCDYSGNQEITVSTIDLLVSKQVDTNSYELAKAVAEMDSQKAFRILPELFAENTDPLQICSAIASSFMDLYRARLALETNRPQNEVVNDFGYKGREFVVRYAMNDCRKFSAEKLRKCIGILAQTDIELKSLRTDSRLIVEKAIVRMLNL